MIFLALYCCLKTDVIGRVDFWASILWSSDVSCQHFYKANNNLKAVLGQGRHWASLISEGCKCFSPEWWLMWCCVSHEHWIVSSRSLSWLSYKNDIKNILPAKTWCIWNFVASRVYFENPCQNFRNILLCLFLFLQILELFQWWTLFVE